MPIYFHRPSVEGAWIAQNASIVGEVIVSKYATIWYGATIKGEKHPIRIGHFTSVGDLTTINSLHSMPHGTTSSTNIGKNVRIGVKCQINSCIIDDDVVIGNNCVIREGAVIERGAQIADNSVVPPGKLIPAHQLWSGNPCTYVRDLTEAE